MAVSVIETIKSRANASNTAYIVVVKLLCDDYSDLPTQSGLSGYELAQGCIAHVINENKDYMIDSSGNWYVYGGDSWTNVYTKSETDALLDDKQDELTTSQLDAVNSGITAAKVSELYDGNLTTSTTNLLSYLDSTLIDTANSSFEIRRYGKMCFARISLKTITSALTGIDTITISAIPAALRPEKSVYFPVVARNQAGWASATLVQTAISVDTNGNVMLRTCTEKTNAAYVIGYFSYYAG